MCICSPIMVPLYAPIHVADVSTCSGKLEFSNLRQKLPSSRDASEQLSSIQTVLVKRLLIRIGDQEVQCVISTRLHRTFSHVMQDCSILMGVTPSGNSRFSLEHRGRNHRGREAVFSSGFSGLLEGLPSEAEPQKSSRDLVAYLCKPRRL